MRYVINLKLRMNFISYVYAISDLRNKLFEDIAQFVVNFADLGLEDKFLLLF